ncbi:hypothetical protein LTR74_018840, partial [Friedmanniomyces endolithicus]
VEGTWRRRTSRNGQEATMAGCERNRAAALPDFAKRRRGATQWKNAKIIPLKKPAKADYTVAKA